MSKKGSWSRPALAGLLAGGAAAVKLTGAGTALIIVLLVVAGIKRWRHRDILSHVIPFGVTAVLMALPFYLRPWLFTGNPLHPFLASWFNTSPQQLALANIFHDMGGRYGLHTFAGFWTSPVLVALKGQLYDGITLGWSFPLLLLLNFYWLLSNWRTRRLRRDWWLPVGFSVYYVFWFFSAQQTRFLQPWLLLSVMMVVFCLARWHPAQRCIVFTVLLVTSVISIPHSELIHYPFAWRVTTAQPPPVAFLTWVLGENDLYMSTMRTVHERTPPEAKIMLLFERRGLYVPRRHVIGSPLFQVAYFSPLPETISDFSEVLTASGVDFLVLLAAPSGPDQLRDHEQEYFEFLQLLDRVIASGKLRIVWQRGPYRLLQVVNA